LGRAKQSRPPTAGPCAYGPSDGPRSLAHHVGVEPDRAVGFGLPIGSLDLRLEAREQVGAALEQQQIFEHRPGALIKELGAKDFIKSDADKSTDADTKASLLDLVDSPLIFPSDADYAKLHAYYTAKNTQDQHTYDSYFVPIVSG